MLHCKYECALGMGQSGRNANYIRMNPASDYVFDTNCGAIDFL